MSGPGGVPSGLRWRLTASITKRSRIRRLGLFLATMRPGPSDKVLDVGVTDTAWRAGNFLESAYEWPGRITAVALTDMPAFREQFPEVAFVVADGRDLPFPDRSFAIGFSNAVIEHVGSREEQSRFVAELLRTCRRVFISTPNARFPVDPHTLLPFIHWLPRSLRHRVLRGTGHGRWAGEQALNPLNARDFLGLFPTESRPRLHRQRLFGLTSVLTVQAGEPDIGAPLRG